VNEWEVKYHREIIDDKRKEWVSDQVEATVIQYYGVFLEGRYMNTLLMMENDGFFRISLLSNNVFEFKKNHDILRALETSIRDNLNFISYVNWMMEAPFNVKDFLDWFADCSDDEKIEKFKESLEGWEFEEYSLSTGKHMRKSYLELLLELQRKGVEPDG
jgi:hypothetical protein